MNMTMKNGHRARLALDLSQLRALLGLPPDWQITSLYVDPPTEQLVLHLEADEFAGTRRRPTRVKAGMRYVVSARDTCALCDQHEQDGAHLHVFWNVEPHDPGWTSRDRVVRAPSARDRAYTFFEHANDDEGG